MLLLMTNVADYLSKRTQILRKSSGGIEIRIECPFCAGHSLDVHSGKGIWHCWSCNESGSFGKLQEKFGSVEKIDFVDNENDVEAELEIDVSPSDILSYQMKLMQHESLLKWLKDKKGLTSESIAKYQIGWDGKAIVFPIRNLAGNYINVKFRGDPTRPGDYKKVWSMRGSHPALFNPEALVSGKRIIVCEGEWDVMLLTQMGYSAVTGTAGTMGWAERMCLSFNSSQEIFLCYDNESSEAGLKGMLRTQEMFNKYGMHTNIVRLPRVYTAGTGDKTDISDYFLRDGHTKEDFDKLLNDSVMVDEAALAKKQIKAWSRASTDTGNAYKIIDLYGDRIRYDVMRHRWLMWRGHRWIPDMEGGTARYYAIKMAREYQKVAVNIEGEERKEALKYAMGLENKNKIANEIEILKILEPVRNDGEGWDSNNWLLGCENGVIDLTNGELRNGRPSDMITMSAKVSYDSAAECPMWLKFLNEIFQGDAEIIHYIHKALGYSITGSTSSQAVFICHGVGANGKSVLFKTIADILGDYAHNAPTSLFQKTKYANAGAATPEVAATEFKRFVVSSETLSDGAINEERLKKWTGGDKENARYLHDNGHEFEVTMKPWLFVNHQPKADDESNGFWRRVKMIPFERVFKPEEQNPKLVEKLLTERAGIFNWLIQGCLLWQKEGLHHEPSKITAATQEYKEDNNELADYIQDRLDVIPGARTLTKFVYKDFVEWSKEEGDDKPIGKKRFNVLFKKNFQDDRNNKDRFYIGFNLKSKLGMLENDMFGASDKNLPDVVTELTSNSNNSHFTRQFDPSNLEMPSDSVTPDTQFCHNTQNDPLEGGENLTENDIKQAFGIID